MNNPRYLHCLYAEDVRPEASGSFSIVGVFQGGIQLPAVPSTLPKLAVVATLSFAESDSLKKLRVEVLFNDRVLQTIELPPEFIEASLRDAKTYKTGRRGFFMQLLISIVGIQIEEVGQIFTRAYVNDEIWNGNGLEIIQATQAPTPE